MGAIIGAAIIGVIENVIVLFGVSPYWQTVVSGGIVVVAVSLDALSRWFFEKDGVEGVNEEVCNFVGSGTCSTAVIRESVETQPFKDSYDNKY